MAARQCAIRGRPGCAENGLPSELSGLPTHPSKNACQQGNLTYHRAYSAVGADEVATTGVFPWAIAAVEIAGEAGADIMMYYFESQILPRIEGVA